jgi:WD40 repeat protein
LKTKAWPTTGTGLAYLHLSFIGPEEHQKTATGRRTGKPARGWDVRQGIENSINRRYKTDRTKRNLVAERAIKSRSEQQEKLRSMSNPGPA